jgi:hypothetical protein
MNNLLFHLNFHEYYSHIPLIIHSITFYNHSLYPFFHLILPSFLSYYNPKSNSIHPPNSHPSHILIPHQAIGNKNHILFYSYNHKKNYKNLRISIGKL